MPHVLLSVGNCIPCHWITVVTAAQLPLLKGPLSCLKHLELYIHHWLADEHKALGRSLSVSCLTSHTLLLISWAFKEAIGFMIHNFLAERPQGGRCSCFSLMEKALGMKFPLTADSFKPCKGSALHRGVNRWGRRTKGRIQMRNRGSCAEEERDVIGHRWTLSLICDWQETLNSQTLVLHSCCLGCNAHVWESAKA